MNQKVISGLGNIYATDALHLAGIHPETNSKKITLKQAKTLLSAIQEVLMLGINNRGSTMPDKKYLDAFGEEGQHQNHFRIYLQENCPVCQNQIKYYKLNGRGTYFCPHCQPVSHDN